MVILESREFQMNGSFLMVSRVMPFALGVTLTLPVIEENEHFYTKFEKVINHFDGAVYIDGKDSRVDALGELNIKMILTDAVPSYDDLSTRLVANIQKIVGISGHFGLKLVANIPGHHFNTTVEGGQ